MAQFRGTLIGNRGAVSRLGTKKSGLSGTFNGWNVGLNLSANRDANDKADIVFATLTGGSSGHNDKLPEIYVMADDKGSYLILLNGCKIAEKTVE